MEKTLTKEKLAKMLDGREYLKEITKEEEKIARDNNLVVLFTQSDDLVEFRGGIYDEVGAYHGTDFYLRDKDLFECDRDRFDNVLEQLSYFKKFGFDLQLTKITAIWDEKGKFLWSFKTDIPHSTFQIFEDKEPYCQGIVFNLDDL